jgi:hypothetical protein
MNSENKQQDFIRLKSFDTDYELGILADTKDIKLSKKIVSRNKLLCQLFDSPSVIILYSVFGNGIHLMDIRGEDKLGWGYLNAHRCDELDGLHNIIFYSFRCITGSKNITKVIVDELHQYFYEFEQEFTIKN